MESPSLTLPEPPIVADFDALTRAARQERLPEREHAARLPTGMAKIVGLEWRFQARPGDSHAASKPPGSTARWWPPRGARPRAARCRPAPRWRSPMSSGIGRTPLPRSSRPRAAVPHPSAICRRTTSPGCSTFLNQQQATYGESLTYHLAAALFYTCSRYSEIAHLRWNDCLLDGGGRIVALRIKGKGSVHATLPVNAILSGVLGEWRTIQEQHRGMKVFAARGLKFLPQRVRVRRSRRRAVHQPELQRARWAEPARTCGCKRSSPPTGCATAPRRSSSTTRARTCARCRRRYGTGTFAPPPGTPTWPRSIPAAPWRRSAAACPS